MNYNFKEKVIITYISFVLLYILPSQMIDMLVHIYILFDLRLLDILFFIITMFKV